MTGIRVVRVSRSVRDRLVGPVRAVVAGVHSGGCHARLESGALVVLVGPDVPLAPNGVALDPGRPVPPPGHRFQLSRATVAAAEVWEPRPRVRPLAPGALGDRLRATRAVAVAEGSGRSLLPLLWDGTDAWGAADAARRLAAAAARRDGASVACAAGDLAGLGPGLTPSGDDLLAGFAAAWALLGAAPHRDRAHARVAAALGSARGGASLLGRAWLEHALAGELPEPMTRFVETLFDAEPRGLAPAARAVLALGASSGTDWMVGFLFGAAALSGASWS